MSRVNEPVDVTESALDYDVALRSDPVSVGGKPALFGWTAHSGSSRHMTHSRVGTKN